jgi:hypothetical protein
MEIIDRFCSILNDGDIDGRIVADGTSKGPGNQRDLIGAPKALLSNLKHGRQAP